MNDSHPEPALEHASIGDDEPLHRFRFDPKLLQQPRRKPCQLASSVHEHLVERAPLASMRDALDAERYVEASHVCHDISPLPRSYHLIVTDAIYRLRLSLPWGTGRVLPLAAIHQPRDVAHVPRPETPCHA